MRAYARSIAAPHAAERSREPRGAMSRRRFLQLSGIAGAGAALAACTRRTATPRTSAAPAPSDGPAVAVVGAGLAGLTAAYRLHEAGVRSQVFEARDRPGGRCWTLRGFEDGQIAEHGGEFVDTRHVHLRGLIDDLGEELEDLWEGWVDGSAWPSVVDGEVVRRGRLDGERQLTAEVVAAAERAGIVRDERYRPRTIMAGTATPGAERMDVDDAASWVEARLPGFWDTPDGKLLDRSFEGWYGLGAGAVSALTLVDYYLAPWEGADERYHVVGGNDRVVDALVATLPEGRITYEAALEAVVRRSDDRIELRFAGGMPPFVADHAIITLPFTTLRDVDLADAQLSDARLDAIANHAMGTNTKLHLPIDRAPDALSVGDRPWSGGMQHADAGWGTWEAVQGQPGDGAVITVFAGGGGSEAFRGSTPHGEAPDALVDATLAAMAQAVPGVDGAFAGGAYLDDWPSDPWARGSYAAFGPGQMTRFWGSSYTAEGALHFAGEHTSTHSQGYLNGGVESGQRAAIEVLGALGVPVPDHIAGLPYTPRLD